MASFKRPLNPLKSAKRVKNPSIVKQPPNTQMSGCYSNMGSDFGVGMKQPTGTFKATSNYAIPIGKVETPSIYYNTNYLDVV